MQSSKSGGSSVIASQAETNGTASPSTRIDATGSRAARGGRGTDVASDVADVRPFKRLPEAMPRVSRRKVGRAMVQGSRRTVGFCLRKS